MAHNLRARTLQAGVAVALVCWKIFFNIFSRWFSKKWLPIWVISETESTKQQMMSFMRYHKKKEINCFLLKRFWIARKSRKFRSSRWGPFVGEVDMGCLEVWIRHLQAEFAWCVKRRRLVDEKWINMYYIKNSLQVFDRDTSLFGVFHVKAHFWNLCVLF